MRSRIFRTICLVAASVFLITFLLFLAILIVLISSVGAETVAVMRQTLVGMLPLIIVTVLLLFGIVLPIASHLSKRIVQPLIRADSESFKSDTSVYPELSPLLARIETQQTRLKEQYAELRRKETEFETATNHMSEGLILLDAAGTVLAVNRAAVKLLDIEAHCVGQPWRDLDPAKGVDHILRRALGGEHTATTITLNGQEYQINASPTVTDHTITGVALLIFDITEKEKAEKMRQEFTANVSHELKTPLHTISGCAELLSGGMVRPEDVPKFSQQIYTEAKRMIALVEDIIKLSRLDEGATETQFENVDLYALATATVQSLSQMASEANVSLSLVGTSTPMFGIRQFLSIILFNLCDNAIKYNRPNGNVTVEVKGTPECAVLTVRDTGIGIPEEAQERIFERFYRVDKSHSKALGGTGLGLSIVKHAAKLHNAQIRLHSIPDVGTTVTVFFPK